MKEVDGYLGGLGDYTTLSSHSSVDVLMELGII